MHDTVKLPRIPARPTTPLRLSADAEHTREEPAPAPPAQTDPAVYPVVMPEQHAPTAVWNEPTAWTQPQPWPPGPGHPSPPPRGPVPRRSARAGGGLRWTVGLLLFLLLSAAAMPIMVYLALTVQSMTGLGTSLSPLGDPQTASVLLLGLAVAGGVGFLPGFVAFTLGTRSPGWGALHGLWTAPLLTIAGLLLGILVMLR